MPRTCAVSRGWAEARLSTAAIAASTQVSGSCSENSGAGCDRSRPCEATATIAPASFTSTAFTPDVPTSIPRNTNSPSCGLHAAGDLRRLFRNGYFPRPSVTGGPYQRPGARCPSTSAALLLLHRAIPPCKRTLKGPEHSRNLTSGIRACCVRSNETSRHARIRACTHLSTQDRSTFLSWTGYHQKWTSVRIPRTTALSVFTPAAL